MSLKLYTDKSEVFECNVALEGASIKESKLRAILKFDDKNLMVEGKINSNGKGEILFPKLKNISEDGEVGKMELEVIAEDAYFQPYEETFHHQFFPVYISLILDIFRTYDIPSYAQESDLLEWLPIYQKWYHHQQVVDLVILIEQV